VGSRWVLSTRTAEVVPAASSPAASPAVSPAVDQRDEQIREEEVGPAEQRAHNQGGCECLGNRLQPRRDGVRQGNGAETGNEHQQEGRGQGYLG